MKPTAAPAVFPLPWHRTMDEVFSDEADGCQCEGADYIGHEEDCPVWLAFTGDAA